MHIPPGPPTSTSQAENQEERRMARVARVTIAGCALLARAACGREAGAAAEPSAPTTTVPASTTTVVTSTTSAPTTTLSPEQHDDADLRALHDRFFQMLVITGNPPDPENPEIAATTTGIQRQRSEEFARTMKELGERSIGEIHGRILEIRHLDADHVDMRDCTFANATRLSAEGVIVGSDGGESKITGLRITRTPDGWRVEDWFTGGSDSCVA